MADDSTRAELDQLRTQLAAQQAELAALRRAVHAHDPRRLPRLPRRFLPLALVAVLLLLTPLSLLAANPFTDLQSGSVHNANIDLIYNAGITTRLRPKSAILPVGHRHPAGDGLVPGAHGGARHQSPRSECQVAQWDPGSQLRADRE